MEEATHVNLIDDEDEKDPLALDITVDPAQQQTSASHLILQEPQILQQSSNTTSTTNTKHSHSLR